MTSDQGQFWTPSREVDDRGGAADHDTGQWDPRNDPNIRTPRQGEVHQPRPQQEWGEGVVTGDPPDHYVHLANGAVIPGSSGGTHYDDPEMGIVPIVRVFPAGRALQ